MAILVIAVPIELVTGLVIDSTVLAHKDVERTSPSAKALPRMSLSLAPLTVPPAPRREVAAGIHNEPRWDRMPAGASLVGRF